MFKRKLSKSLSQRISSSKRDDQWLAQRLNKLWEKYFPDIELSNKVLIRFGRYSSLRLGSIRLDRTKGISYITITSMFRDLRIPQDVVDHTVAHELVHYAHGFSSQRVRLHKYPHAGGVVHREMDERGLEYLHTAYKKWVKKYREQLKKHYA